MQRVMLCSAAHVFRESANSHTPCAGPRFALKGIPVTLMVRVPMEVKWVLREIIQLTTAFSVYYKFHS